MKKSFVFYLLLIPFLSLSPVCGLCQPCKGIVKIIKLNFKNNQWIPNSTDLNKIKPGECYQLVIEGINQNLYKIELGKQDSTISTTEIEKIGDRLDLELASKLIASFGAFGGTVSLTVADLLKDSSLLTVLNLQNTESFLNPDKPQVKPGNKKKQSDTEKKADEEARIIKQAKEDLDSLIRETQKKLVTAFDDALSLKNNTETMKVSFQRKLTSYKLADGTPDPLEFSDIEDEFNEIRQNVIGQVNILNNTITDYKSRYAAFLKIIPEKERGRYIIEHDVLINLNTELIKLLVSMEKQVDAESVKSIMNKLVFAQNNQCTTYTSIPLQFTKEITTLNISIKPRSDTLGLQSYLIPIVFPIKEDKKYYYGISSGFYFSTLHDDAYSVKSSSTDNYNLIAENPGGLEIGINAMFRIGWQEKKESDWSFIFGFGPGVSFSNKIRPRLFLGLGAAYGDKNKFIVDIGLSTGPVDRLSNAFDETTTYTSAPNNFMVSAMRWGGYLSISYLFVK